MARDIKQLSDADLKEKLSDLRTAIRDIDLGRKAPGHPRERRETRREIARIMTELSARNNVHA
ncbi:MAG: 50S ribosomal protein L29 [Candidatus Paceibacterota bacterium]